MAERMCVECGAAVPGRGPRLYCSSACALVTRTCTGCGEQFSVERKRKGRNFACSLSCRDRRPPVPKADLTCAECGSHFQRWASQLTGQRGRFCSRTCAGLGRPINGKPSTIATEAIELFRTRHPISCEPETRISRWSIDLAIPSLNLAVELDGEYWHSLPAMADRDRRKDEWLTAHGWRVIRIPMSRHDNADTIALRIAQEVSLCLS